MCPESVNDIRNTPKVARLLEALTPYGADRIYVFGSYARGEADILSDLDLVIVKRTLDSFFERLRKVAGLLPAGVGGVDILVYTPEEFGRMREEGNAFVEMIQEEGVLVHGR